MLNQYLYAKKEFLACSSSTIIKQVCLPVWEVAFLTFESSVLVGGFVPLDLHLGHRPQVRTRLSEMHKLL